MHLGPYGTNLCPVTTCLLLSFQQESFGCYQASDVDPIAASLLRGAAAVDGGGVGTPVDIKGNGACFMNALASSFLNRRYTRNCPGDGPALALRLAAVRLALVKMKDFLSPDLYLEDYCSGQLWDALEHETVLGITGNVYVSDLTPDIARLYYLAAVRSIASPYSLCQQACLPWVSEVLQVKVRVFHPGRL